MVADDLLTRQRYREVPPRVDYELTERARALVPVLGALAEWGYEWTWSEPRKGEHIDIGAILRCGPGLLMPDPSLTGSLCCEVLGERGADRHYVLHVEGGEASLVEDEAEGPDAKVSGPVRAWVQALGPGGDKTGLEFEGDRALADAIISQFAEAAARSTERAAA